MSASDLKAENPRGVRMPVYLDHASTTPVDVRVAARMAEVLRSESEYGNPASTSHAYGDVAGALVEAARGQVAAAVGANNAAGYQLATQESVMPIGGPAAWPW